MGTPTVKAIERDAGIEQNGGTDEITVIAREQWDFDSGNESASLQMITVTSIEHDEYAKKRKEINKVYNNSRDSWVAIRRKNSKDYKKLVDNCSSWKNFPDVRQQLIGHFKRFQQGISVKAPQLTDNVKLFLTEKEKLDNKLREEYLEIKTEKLLLRDKNNMELAYRECLDDKDKFMQITITGELSTFVLEGFYLKRRANDKSLPTTKRNNSLAQTICQKQLNPTKFSIARPLEKELNPKSGKEMVACPTEWSYSTYKIDSPSLIMIKLTSIECSWYEKERRIRDKQIKDNCNEWIAKEKNKKDGEYKTLLKNNRETESEQDELDLIIAKNEIDEKLKKVYANKLFNEIDSTEWRCLELAYRGCLENENTFMTTTKTSKLSTYALRAFFEKRKANGGPFSIIETKNVGEHSKAENKIVINPTQWDISFNNLHDHTSLSIQTLSSNEYAKYAKEKEKSDDCYKDRCKAWVRLKVKKLDKYKELLKICPEGSKDYGNNKMHLSHSFKQYQQCRKINSIKLTQNVIVFLTEQQKLEETLNKNFLNKELDKLYRYDAKTLNCNILKVLKLAYRECSGNEDKFLEITVTCKWSTVVLREFYQREEASSGPTSSESGQLSKTSEDVPASHRRLEEVNNKPCDETSDVGPNIEPINAETITENFQGEMDSTTFTDRSRFPHISAISETGTTSLKRPLCLDTMANTVDNYAPQFKKTKTVTDDSQNVAPLEDFPVFAKSSLLAYSNKGKNESADYDYQSLKNRNQMNQFGHTPQNQNNGHQISKHNQHLQSQFHNVKEDRIKDETMEQSKPISVHGHGFQSLRQSTPMKNVNRFIGGNFYPECIRIEPEPI